MGYLVLAGAQKQLSYLAQPLKLLFSFAAVVELVDTQDLKSCGRKTMSVRVRPAAPIRFVLNPA